MISFIIIGKNEAKTLELSIKSVIKTIQYNKIENFEIIYVDSNSNDNSINIAKSFNSVKVFIITGECNAAVARNIGVNEASGDILYFLDGDMEINPDFFSIVIKNNKLIYPFVSGQLINIFYTQEWKYEQENEMHPNLQNDQYSYQTGGYFIIERKTWFLVNGMDTKYRRSQDIDFALRLAKLGILLLRKKETFGKHHTINYFNKARRWNMLFDFSFLFQTSVLYRDHFTNKYIYKLALRNSYSLISLLVSILLVNVYFPFIFIYPFTILMRICGQFFISKQTDVTARLFYFILLDFLILMGFFTFFPSKKIIKYQRV